MPSLPYLWLSVIIIVVGLGQSLKFDCSVEHLETCTQQLLKFSREDVPVPENEEQVLDNCEIIRNGTRCIRKYFSNCAPSGIKQIGKLALGGVTRAINKRCSAEGIREFLSHRQCIVSIKKPAQLCYHSMVQNLYRINASESELLHPSICCFISKMHDCNTEALKTSCKDEANKQLYGHETEKMIDDMMELICPTNLRWGKPDCDEVADKLAEIDIPTGEDPSLLPLIMNVVRRLAD